MKSAYEVYPSPDGWRWRLRAGNREKVSSGEAYTSKRGALRGVRSHREAAATEVVIVVDSPALKPLDMERVP